MKRPKFINLVGAATAFLAAFSCAGGELTHSEVPVPQSGMEARHKAQAAAARAHSFDLLMIGDSITNNFEKPEYRSVWNAYFAPRNALNLGYSAARTENILWNLSHGELDGQAPKVAVVLIGTNNSDDANFGTVDSPEQIAGGTAAIARLILKCSPTTRVLLLRIFPRHNIYSHPDGSLRGSEARRFETNQRAGELVSALADNRSVLFLDLNYVFLRLDGSIDPVLMPDLLHPSPEGASRWARAMEPTLSRLMGDSSLIGTPSNSAVVPVPKLEDYFYDWWGRHQAILAIKDTVSPDVVLVGDSITHLWGGDPAWTGRPAGGAHAFAQTFAGKSVLNLGFGYDRIQNVLWRLDHGEVDGLRPKWVVVNIGTNNLGSTSHARANTPEEIGDGVVEVLLRLRDKLPASNIVLMGLFPRGEFPANSFRRKVADVNVVLAGRISGSGITYLDLGHEMVGPDGKISRDIMGDFLHPSESGYAIWGNALDRVMR